MKRLAFWMVLTVISGLLSSCLINEEQSTPVMKPISYLYRTSAAGVRDSIRYGDTIHVGDTLQGSWVLYCVTNNLTSFTFKTDTFAFDYHLVCDSAYAHLLTEKSKPEEGKLFFVSGCVFYPVDIYFVAKQKGDYPLSLSLASDAGEKYSPQMFSYTQAIR